MSDTTAHSDRDPEAFEIFVEESFEGLARVESLLLSAEAGEPPRDMLTVMFRDLHTIKGTASFLDLPRIPPASPTRPRTSWRACAAGVLAPTARISGMLLRVVVLRTMITEARATGEEATATPRGSPRSSQLERPAPARARGPAPREIAPCVAVAAHVTARRPATPVPAAATPPAPPPALAPAAEPTTAPRPRPRRSAP
ncbi:MAG: Hpt domain-containing protein [Polyangiales bacterium]